MELGNESPIVSQIKSITRSTSVLILSAILIVTKVKVFILSPCRGRRGREHLVGTGCTARQTGRGRARTGAHKSTSARRIQSVENRRPISEHLVPTTAARFRRLPCQLKYCVSLVHHLDDKTNPAPKIVNTEQSDAKASSMIALKRLSLEKISPKNRMCIELIRSDTQIGQSKTISDIRSHPYCPT
ncbi:hypothetical protein EVAR_91579_1 [Eumeta japonica]|uniref:Uncharacterized protein n=1 Tax=Eumeta variegata TaxID=151549 RepID=A0A4C1XDN1_EUMVA|nr:hypothetical protein EVAR_91579_1 [Eumeta japonica]